MIIRAADLSISAGLCQAQKAVLVHWLLAPQIPPGLVQAGGSFEGIPPNLSLLPHNLCELLQGCHCGCSEVQRAEHSSQARVCLHQQYAITQYVIENDAILECNIMMQHYNTVL